MVPTRLLVLEWSLEAPAESIRRGKGFLLLALAKKKIARLLE
jgi:hypothetical protein